MANKKYISLTLKGTNNSGNADVLAEKHIAMDELRCHNQKLEDNVHNIIHEFGSAYPRGIQAFILSEV